MPHPYRGLAGNFNEMTWRDGTVTTTHPPNPIDRAKRNIKRNFQSIGHGLNSIRKALPEVPKPITDTLDSPEGQLVQEAVNMAGPGKALLLGSKVLDAGIEHFDLDPRLGMLPLLGMLSTGKAPKSGFGMIKGPAARRIQGSLHLKTPKKLRADSFKPNLPQNVVDDYIADSTKRLRGGARNRKDIPYLIDNEGEIFRMDQKGWERVGDISQKKYALISQRLKNARNAQVAGVRQQKVNLNTAPGTDQRDFYFDPDVRNQHNPKFEDAHHRRILDSESKLRRGLSKRENRILDGYFTKKGAGEGGNSRFNRDNLPKEVHKALHSWQTRFKKATGADVTELNLTQRKQYIDQFVEDLKLSDIKTYRLMQNHLKKQSLKLPKKTEPTQWSDFRARNIKRDVELFGQAEWKVGDAKVTWYPNKNNPLKGRGQIDILEQAGKTKPKGVKALVKDFNDSLKDFPSGVQVELNPKWKDAKRRSIYENYVFKNHPNIKRNADPTLGWVYTAP